MDGADGIAAALAASVIAYQSLYPSAPALPYDLTNQSVLVPGNHGGILRILLPHDFRMPQDLSAFGSRSLPLRVSVAGRA